MKDIKKQKFYDFVYIKRRGSIVEKRMRSYDDCHTIIIQNCSFITKNIITITAGFS